MHRPRSSSPRAPRRGSTADKYIRDTVFLATVLFLVGITATSRCARPPGPDHRGRRPPRLRGDPTARPARTARQAGSDRVQSGDASPRSRISNGGRSTPRRHACEKPDEHCWQRRCW
jgi:hypothetical protein